MSATPITRPTAVRLQSVDARTVLARSDAVVVDLRSPGEFAEDHLPGAVNLPLFDDVERALIGTLYRQISPDVAFEEGRSIVGARITQLVADIAAVAGWDVDAAGVESRLHARFADMTAAGFERLSSDLTDVALAPTPDRPVVLHCWRGGLRSRSVVALVRELGLARAVVLAGGYKGYRAEIVREIEAWTPPRTFVLRGLTGVGKTLVLRELERIRPGWTLDLEGLAGHRSSLLGMVGLEPRSQKAFESGLAARVRAGFRGPLVVEGESRKVGDVYLPRGLWAAMCGGVAIELVAPVERRVRVLEEDYLATPASRAQLIERLPAVEERMEREAGAPSLAAMLERGETDALVRLLLERYYDPLYRHSQRACQFAVTIDATDPARAAREIGSWIETASRG